MVEAGALPSGSIDQNRWALRDWIAGAALFAATAGVILWQNAHVAVLFDISYILNIATRIAGGQVPYRDFPLAQAPLTFLVQAAIIRFTGRVFFHHVLYVAMTGGLSTVLTWRIALESLRKRMQSAWMVALLLAAPLVFLSVYSIMPNPEYDADCAFWILVAVWGLQRVTDSLTNNESRLRVSPQPTACHPEGSLPRVAGLETKTQPGSKNGPCLQNSPQPTACHPERTGPQTFSGDPRGQSLPSGVEFGGGESKDLRLFLKSPRILCAFVAGSALCLPLFFKQNMGLPFLLAVFFVILAQRFGRNRYSEIQDLRLLLSLLAGCFAALIVSMFALQITAGLGNYIHWTIAFAGQRRMPGLDAMLGVYWYPQVAWLLPCAMIGFALLRFIGRFDPRPGDNNKNLARIAQLAAFLLLAAPFLYAIAALFLYSDDPDSRGDSFLMIWPVLLVLATVLALINLWRSWKEPSIRALLPLVLLAAINGTMMSQQLWGSTYGIWPLLTLLLAELLAILARFAPKRFTLAFAAFVSASMLVCGGFYTASEERLAYAQLPDGPPMHSEFPALAGMATPGPFLPELDELLRYAQANIPFRDGVILMPGEDPFFFANGRAQLFPTTIWDNTCDPYSPEQIVAMARAHNIRWLIVKTHLQLNADPTPDRAATLDLLTKEFALAAHLHGYDVYRARTAE